MEHDEVVDEVCMVEQEGRADGNTTSSSGNTISSSEGDGVASSSSSNSSSSTLREVEGAPMACAPQCCYHTLVHYH